MIIKNLLYVAALASVVSCQNKSKSDESSEVPVRTEFLDKAGMDTTVRPGDDFNLYASGAWFKKAVIPESESQTGSFFTLYENNQKQMKTILEETSTGDYKKGSEEQKVGDLYASGMDTVTMNKLGFDPIKPQLKQIADAKTTKDLISLLAEGYKEGNGMLLGHGVGADDKISTKNAVFFMQSGLGLPNRDYYMNTDSASKKIRDEYVKYISKLLVLTGVPQAAATKSAGDILKLETKIAEAHITPVELRDPIKNYNKYAVKDFQKQVPGLDLTDLLKRMEIKTDTIIVSQPKYYQALDKLLKSEPLDAWKSKATFTAINTSAGYLSQPFRDARFDFFGKILNGQQKQRDRWKQMASEVDNDLGELLGKIYAEKYFPKEAKDRMLSLVNNLQVAFKARIEKLDWMSPDTKKEALAKLNTFIKKIGYPDKWKNYDDVEISRDKFYENLKSVARHDYKEEIDKIGKPVDKTEWQMTPATVNAYYNPSYNEIVFPAGILQFPFFDVNADDAINYGSIGAVIGHEMTHGFDDQGRQYDKDGNLKEWWTKADADKFKTRAQVVVDQYNKYTVLNTLHVNGSLTLGENIADIGGLTIAYDAFKKTKQGQSNEKIDGFTPDQRFFLSFAQAWKSKMRDELSRRLISEDPHSPDKYRLNGSVSNIPQFYKAFDVKPGDKLYRPEDQRVHIW